MSLDHLVCHLSTFCHNIFVTSLTLHGCLFSFLMLDQKDYKDKSKVCLRMRIIYDTLPLTERGTIKDY